MPVQTADRVKETTTGTGTGDLDLAGAATGFRTFNAAFGTGSSNLFYYSIFGGSEWEVGISYMSDSDTLKRAGSQTVLSSSNSGSAVSFLAGTKTVVCTIPGSIVPGVRVATATIDLSNDSTKQNLLPAVPTGLKRMVTEVRLHSPSDAAEVQQISGDLRFGFNSNANNWNIFYSNLFLLVASDNVVTLPSFLDLSNEAVFTYRQNLFGAAGETFGALVVGTGIPETIDVDILFYDV